MMQSMTQPARGVFLTTPPRRRYAFLRTLYFRVLVGIVAGILVGIVYPHLAQQLKPFGDGFIKLIRMMVAPIIFFSVVVGIASVGSAQTRPCRYQGALLF
jgi:aerobic C4-dicarboxylate transport protein